MQKQRMSDVQGFCVSINYWIVLVFIAVEVQGGHRTRCLRYKKYTKLAKDPEEHYLVFCAPWHSFSRSYNSFSTTYISYTDQTRKSSRILNVSRCFSRVLVHLFFHTLRVHSRRFVRFWLHCTILVRYKAVRSTVASGTRKCYHGNISDLPGSSW